MCYFFYLALNKLITWDEFGIKNTNITGPVNFLKVTAPDYIEVRFVKTINKKNGICSQDPTLSFKNKIIVFRSFLTKL